MKYGELIQFDPIQTTIQLKDANKQDSARRLVKSFVISEKMAEKITKIIFNQLQFEKFADNKALWIIGNYGSGKSHLMSVISALAEYAELAEYLTNDDVKEKAEKIAGKFQVIRFEIDATTMILRDIIVNQLEKGLEEKGVDFEFPPIDEISSSHKPYFEAMMSKFHEKYPDQGLLLVCDELLDYLNSRDQQQLALDLPILRAIGEVAENTSFRFMAGVQEAIFDSSRLQFFSAEVRRIKDRAEQVLIAREDIKFVVAERLLKKTAQQQTQIKNYLQKFTKFYEKMNDRLDEFVRLFPVHPDYIDVFERVTGIENRQVLKSLSLNMKELLDKEVPDDTPGVLSYDAYWYELKDDTGFRTKTDVRKVIDCSEVLVSRIQQAYPDKKTIPLAERLIAALSMHRLAVGDVFIPVGATAKELKDSLCLYMPGIEDMPGDASVNLETQIVTTLRKIYKTVNGQFISKNKDNDQFYLDLKKDRDYDAQIEQKADVLSDDSLNTAYRAAMLEILEQTDEKQDYISLWEHELKWPEHNINRPGWLFLGSPNERETAKPPLDYYMYFIQPKKPPKLRNQPSKDEVLFRITKADQEFDQELKFYAAAMDLFSNTTGAAKNIYKDKADDYLKKLTQWLNKNVRDAYEVQYLDQKKSMMDWLSGTSLRAITGIASDETLNVKDIFNAVASHILSSHFKALAPEYPKFSQWITGESMDEATRDVLRSLAGGARTKRATAVLDALMLLNGNKLSPATSPYAKTLLNYLKQKGVGQVVNSSELLFDVNTRLYFEPTTYRLEPQWLIVLIAVLVREGELELAITGNKFDASDITALANTSLDDLVNFKHIQAPKDFNIPALKQLFELLSMAPGLALNVQNGDDDVVREMQTKVTQLVQALVMSQQLLRERLPLWGQHVLGEAEAQDYKNKIDTIKDFIETLQRFKTPGQLKNLKISVDDIQKQKENRDAFFELTQLSETVKEFEGISSYLGQAQQILPIEHPWQKKIKQSGQDLLAGLADKEKRADNTFKQKLQSALQALKTEYGHEYVTLYQRARLTLKEDKRKSSLNTDDRLQTLEKLSSIELLSSSQFTKWRSQWAELKVAQTIDSQSLTVNPNPVNFDPKSEETQIPAINILNALDSQLDTMNNDWVATLKTNLEDPFIQLELLKPEQKILIEKFINTNQLPSPLGIDFVEAVNQLLSGLEPVNITMSDFLDKLGGKGTPLTLNEITERFQKILSESCKGKDKNKVRIIIE